MAAVLGAPTPEVEERIRFWAMAAVNATDVDVEPFEIHVGVLDHGREWAVDPERILMAETVAAVLKTIASLGWPGSYAGWWQRCRSCALGWRAWSSERS